MIRLTHCHTATQVNSERNKPMRCSNLKETIKKNPHPDIKDALTEYCLYHEIERTVALSQLWETFSGKSIVDFYNPELSEDHYHFAYWIRIETIRSRFKDKM